MSKVLVGKVVSLGMQETILVEVVRRTPHKLYKKLLKRSKKYKVDPNGLTPVVGNTVKIQETKPLSKEKHFKLIEIEDKKV